MELLLLTCLVGLTICLAWNQKIRTDPRIVRVCASINRCYTLYIEPAIRLYHTGFAYLAKTIAMVVFGLIGMVKVVRAIATTYLGLWHIFWRLWKKVNTKAV